MIADSSEIKFECAQCGQSIAVDISGAGLSTNCPTCDNPLVVPSPSSFHDREYGESAPLSPGRADYAGEDAGISAGEAEELREELAEALRRGDESVEPTLEQGVASGGRGYTRSTYRSDAGETIAEHWLVQGAGHAWSGGSVNGSYTDPKGPNATDEMLRFFFEHPLRAG